MESKTPTQSPEITTVVYQKCLNCGNFMTLQKDSKQVYCSPECAREFRVCPVCGRFFSGPTFPDGTCSPECAQDHPEYYHLFKEFE